MPVAFYDDPNFDYRAYWSLRVYENKSDKEALARLLEQVFPKNSLIDVSGGFGRLATIYSPLFEKCTLTDPSERLLAGAKKYLGEKKIKNVSLKKSGTEKLPYQDKSFDVALFIRVIHHLDEPKDSLTEIGRVLKSNGFLILEFANKNHLLANLAAIKRLDFHYLADHIREDRRGKLTQAQQQIPFYNYHPAHMENLLRLSGFRVVKNLSVSNFRNPWLKKLIPSRILLAIERFSQPLLIHLFFGPSIFILAQKSS